jgi:hypothetical protein
MSPGRSRWLRAGVFAAWFAATSVPIGYLMAGHLAPAAVAEAPQAGDRWPERARGRWEALHVVARDCPCSGKAVAHLLERGAGTGIHERVWVTGQGAMDVSALAARGYDVDPAPADARAAAAGITAAPWLIVIAPDGRVAYSGGYRDGSAAREWDDVRMIAAAQRGEAPRARPVFGCALGQLRRHQDPLGLKWLRRLG